MIENKRIAKNTLMLYIRQVVAIVVSLYTVRIVLDVLGVEDYGLYNVVGGVVSLFSVLSGSLSMAAQRFFSFALGENNVEKLNKTFSVNLIIYVAIGLITFVLLETIGQWYIYNRLNVPEARHEAVIYVFHFSVLTFVATILATPFRAMIMAHEDMQIYAYMSILEAILKLGAVYLLSILPWDKLETHGTLIFGTSSITSLIYVIISSSKYAECQFRKFYWDKSIFISILNFTSWSLYGQVSAVLRKQAITILLNQAFSPVVVAARAIAENITSRIGMFSSNFMAGLYPPIIKSYATDDKNDMYSLIYNGSKIAFFLMWVFALPLIIEMNTILNLWLKNPPPEAVLFTRLALVEVIIHSISSPLTAAARAPGKMKKYELTLGTIQIGIFVGAWLVVKMGFPPHYVYFIAIAANIVMFFVRLVIVRDLTGLPLYPFFKKVVYPVIYIVLLSLVPSYLLHSLLQDNVLSFIIVVLGSVAISLICMYYIGLDAEWREKVRNIISSKIRKTF